MNERRIGVISDIRGLLRPQALEALRGSSLITHAGDIGTLEVLESLRRLAPVAAVRGNVDQGAWCQALPLSETVEIDQMWLYVIHNLSTLDLDPRAAGFGALISKKKTAL